MRRGAIHLPTDAATMRLGAVLGETLAAGDALLLTGDLGAGKTTLARALVRSAIPDVGETPSPTFTLVQTYEADPPIWHADLYRVADASELVELGLDEAFDEAVCVVEWPDRLGEMAPSRYLAIELRFADNDARTAGWRCVGEGWSAAAAALSALGVPNE